jgi:hypothetical protein
VKHNAGTCLYHTVKKQENPQGQRLYLYGRAIPNWPRGLKRGFTAARLLELRVRILPGGIDVCLVSVVCCQVEVSATGQSVFQISPTECDQAQQKPSSTMMIRQKEFRI